MYIKIRISYFFKSVNLFFPKQMVIFKMYVGNKPWPNFYNIQSNIIIETHRKTFIHQKGKGKTEIKN